MAVASPRLLCCLADTQPVPGTDAQRADKHDRHNNGFPVAFQSLLPRRSPSEATGAEPSPHWHPEGKEETEASYRPAQVEEDWAAPAPLSPPRRLSPPAPSPAGDGG